MKCCSLQPASTSNLQPRQFFRKVALASIWYTQVTCKLSDRNVGCTIDAVPEHGSKMYLNLCQIQKQCQEPKIEIHCRPARQALSCIAANPYKNTSHRPRLSFQACLASPFGISCVPNNTVVPQIHCSPARQALCSTSPVLETPVKIRPSSPNILFQAC